MNHHVCKKKTNPDGSVYTFVPLLLPSAYHSRAVELQHLRDPSEAFDLLRSTKRFTKFSGKIICKILTNFVTALPMAGPITATGQAGI